MTATALKKELSTYLPLLSARQQALILDMIKNILHVDSKEKRISLEQYNAEIESALKEVKQGKSISHEDVLKQSRKWLKRK
jgi:predicted amino acid-binding ACT domain protein